MRREVATVVGALTLALLPGCTTGTPAEVEVPPDGPGVTGEAPRVVGDLTLLDPVVDRAAHTASLLPDGRVLVIGGCVVDGCSDATAETELYDPATGRFSSGADLAQPRDGHTATTLPNGDVLLVGGYTGEGERPLPAAELYVAASGEFVPAGEMSIGRGAHAAALLDEGRVLVVGGWVGPRTFTETAEIWDPATREFTAVSSLPAARGSATATRLPDGRVLVLGGEDEPQHGLATSELYDPVSDTWEHGPSMAQPRFKHAAVALASGDVLVVGGTPDDNELIAAVERFDGSAFRTAGELTEGRYKLVDAVVAVPDGRVLVAGGGQSAEAYDPATQTASTVASIDGSRSSFATATVLNDGSVLVVGGYDKTIDLRREAYLLGVLAPA